MNWLRKPGSCILAIIRRSTRAPTIKAVRGPVAINGIFDD